MPPVAITLPLKGRLSRICGGSEFATERGGGITWMVICPETTSGGENESWIVTVDAYVPTTVALPRIRLLRLLSLSPNGSEPPVNVKVRGSTPAKEPRDMLMTS